MLQCGKLIFPILFFLLSSTHTSIGKYAARTPVPVVLDLSAAQIRPTIDDSVMTNIDAVNLPFDEEDSKYPTALQEGQSISTITIMSEELIRERRQIVNPLLGENYLFFGNEQFLVNINRDGTGVQGIRSGTRNMIAVDFDIREKFMFWSDIGAKHIARTKMDGTQLTILVQTDITTPDGIAWDWVNKKLYWTDAGERDIEVLDPNTRIRSVILLTGIEGESIPRAIVLDPFARKIYWTDWGSLPRIERVSYDGTQRQTLHSFNLLWPNAMTLDLISQTLYWADAGLDRIECSKSDGSGRKILIGQFINHPFGIDFFDGTLYWTDWQLRAVLNSTITHSSTSGVFTIYGVISNLLNRPMGLKVVSLSKQPLVRPPVQPSCTPSCQNGGNCTQPGVCSCPLGWTGVRCETPVCELLCLNGGICSSPGICTCLAGWTGSACNEAVCGNGCNNGGSCLQPGVCTCPDGWHGTRCDQPICSRVCEHGSCTGPDVCTCRQGWTGDWCGQAICNPTCVNGDCLRPDECVCHSGWKERLCTDPICEPGCINGGDCIAPNICECFSPFYGPRCAEVDCFPPSGCMNNGSCVSPSQCSCPFGWAGIRCEISICGNIRCLHGECTKPNQCDCSFGWEGETCEEAVCFPPSGCQNGGKCIIPGICSCASGWTGEKCDKGICAQNCNGHGSCVGPNQCDCDEGWFGPQSACNQAICTPKCVHGYCIRPNLCACDIGYGGFRCEY